jgi:hypothetical protein
LVNSISARDRMAPQPPLFRPVEAMRRGRCSFVIRRERIEGLGGEFIIHVVALSLVTAPIAA